MLRLLVGDRIKPGMDESLAFFSDEELQAILDLGGGEVYWAASVAWGMKAAEYANLIDIDESGSTRKLSQKHRQALQMWNYYEEQARTLQNFTPPSARPVRIYSYRGQT